MRARGYLCPKQHALSPSSSRAAADIEESVGLTCSPAPFVPNGACVGEADSSSCHATTTTPPASLPGAGAGVMQQCTFAPDETGARGAQWAAEGRFWAVCQSCCTSSTTIAAQRHRPRPVRHPRPPRQLPATSSFAPGEPRRVLGCRSSADRYTSPSLPSRSLSSALQSPTSALHSPSGPQVTKTKLTEHPRLRCQLSRPPRIHHFTFTTPQPSPWHLDIAPLLERSIDSMITSLHLVVLSDGIARSSSA